MSKVGNRRLEKLTYKEIGVALGKLTDDALIELMDSRSVKVGDTASSILSTRDRIVLVTDCLIGNKFTTQFGKIRALNLLCSRGKKGKRSNRAFLQRVDDKSVNVVDCALFGLVFWQDKRVLPLLKELQSACLSNSSKSDLYFKAIHALEMSNPYLYSPHFSDEENVWKLTRKK